MMSAIVMSVFLVAALCVFCVLMVPRMRLVFRAPGDSRMDRVPERLQGVLKFAIGQWRMPRDPVAGFAHIFIFSGFMVVALGTVLHFVHAYNPTFVDRFYLESGFGHVYGVTKDIFELLVLVGVSYGLWRRLKPTPSRVGRSWEGVFVLAMIGLLMVTDFLVFGGLVLHAEGPVPFYPGAAIGQAILTVVGPVASPGVVDAAYWIHCVAVLVFLNFLPLGKHFHVITGIPNVFFRDLAPYGQVPKMEIDLDSEEDPKFGMRSTADLDWKMILDTYSCTECGRCLSYCPTAVTDKPLTHRQLNLDIKKSVFEDQEALLSGDADRIDGLADLVGGNISADTIWACTTCGACEQECPVFIENVPRIIQMRQNKVLMEGDITPELQRAFDGMERNQNPWGLPADSRDEWTQDLPEGTQVPRLGDWLADNPGSADDPPLLYWVGCAGSFDDRTKKVTAAMVKILNAANVPFAILGKEEGCTGDSARRAGNEYLFQILAETNVGILNEYGVKKILTTCPHCLHTIKREYPQFGGDYEVVHHTEFIEKLMAEGRIEVRDEDDTSVAYHDSCYLGRYHDIYDAPRNILEGLPDIEPVEAPRNRSRSFCCGAGGARFWMEETIGERINVNRAKELAALETDKVGTNCPFCLTMIGDGMKDPEVDKPDVPVQDLAEIVAAKLV